MKRTFTFLLMLSLLLAACSKSVESENESWERNQRVMKDLKVSFPNFTDVLDAQLTAARKEYDAVSSIADEEAKIVQLEKANRTLNVEFVRNLRAIQRNLEKLRKELSKLDVRKVNTDLTAAKQRALRQAEKALRQAEQLPQQAVSDVNNATSVSRKTNDDLKNALESIDRVNDQMDKIEREARKAKEKTQQQTEKSKTPVTTVVCEYCGTKNKAELAKCSSCGGNLPQKK